MTNFRIQMISLPAGRMRRRMARCAVPVAALLAISVLVISCGSAKHRQAETQPSGTPSQSATTGTASPSQPSTGALPGHTTPAGTPACAAADIAVLFDSSRGEGAAGTAYYVVGFKNVSGHTC
ncbi:MAG TPA: hypothetical protein VE287_12435, partial [Actinopolymorphaceae bacterium]|nr:hypothetical protein [Actinopolymorphaceae bacterium]